MVARAFCFDFSLVARVRRDRCGVARHFRKTHERRGPKDVFARCSFSMACVGEGNGLTREGILPSVYWRP